MKAFNFTMTITMSKYVNLSVLLKVKKTYELRNFNHANPLVELSIQTTVITILYGSIYARFLIQRDRLFITYSLTFSKCNERSDPL